MVPTANGLFNGDDQHTHDSARAEGGATIIASAGYDDTLTTLRSALCTANAKIERERRQRSAGIHYTRRVVRTKLVAGLPTSTKMEVLSHLGHKHNVEE